MVWDISYFFDSDSFAESGDDGYIWHFHFIHCKFPALSECWGLEGVNFLKDTPQMCL